MNRKISKFSPPPEGVVRPVGGRKLRRAAMEKEGFKVGLQQFQGLVGGR